MSDKSEFTPVQRRMLDVLSDGMRHSREELHQCLSDDLAELAAITHHISAIRKVLRPRGQTIVCELGQGIWYRWVKLISRSCDDE